MHLFKRMVGCGAVTVGCRRRRMTDFELETDDAIATWYQNFVEGFEENYFNNRTWNQLYEEQKQIVAQWFWQEMLS